MPAFATVIWHQDKFINQTLNYSLLQSKGTEHLMKIFKIPKYTNTRMAHFIHSPSGYTRLYFSPKLSKIEEIHQNLISEAVLINI